ncbi:MAG: metalloprotease [Thermoplasmatota archaeon]
MAYEGFYEDRPRVRFSGIEILHLLASIVVLTVGFSFALGQTSLCNFSLQCGLGMVQWSRVEVLLPWSAIIVVTSFLLHEMAHKVSAQSKHMWAEFRASGYGLITALVAAFATGIVLAAPGAVHIIGDASERDSGVISIVGPMVNIGLAILAIPFTLRAPTTPLYDGGPDFFQVLLFVNAFLAAFNMLPIYPLDGSKVWRWSKMAYLGTVVVIVALFAVLFLGQTAFGGCVGQSCNA